MQDTAWGTATASPVPEPPERRVWRDRLPEIIATIGATLVALAVTGFLSSTWEHISEVQKAMVLGAAAAGLTVVGLWADAARRPLELVVSLCWATATLLTASAVTLAGFSLGGELDRAAIATGGLAGAAHAALLLARRPSSLLQQTSLFAALLFAAGPPGTALSERWSWDHVGTLLYDPLVGLFDPSHTVDAFAVTGIAYFVIAAAWVALAGVMHGRARLLSKSFAVTAATFAALQLNVLAAPVGAVGALAIVLAFLVYGLIADDAGLVTAGAIGCLVAGVRVLAALFSGAVLVTLVVFAGGLAMLGWAFWSMRHRART
jgi:hypothetical protein